MSILIKPADISVPATATHHAAAVIALCSGILLILTVGFAPLAAVHNAAHDTRHSAAFPCH